MLLGAGAVQAAFTLITLAAAVLVSQSVYLGLVWQVRRSPTCVACFIASLRGCTCCMLFLCPRYYLEGALLHYLHSLLMLLERRWSNLQRQSTMERAKASEQHCDSQQPYAAVLPP